MNTESREHISSLMDGEVSRETGRFLVRRLGADEELCATWARYHLVRDCLRHQDGGLATVAGALGSDEVTGTLDHLAPEALAGCADQRADLYGLGSTLYFLASDRLARGVGGGLALPARIRALLAEEPPPLRSLQGGLPEGFALQRVSPSSHYGS